MAEQTQRMPLQPIKKIGAELAWECPWYAIQKERVVFPNGSEGEMNVIDMPDGVMIVPLTPEGRIVLIKNYRYAARQWFWEVPAGGIKDGSTPMETAHLELLEEIGGHAERIEGVGTFYQMPGLCTQVTYVFLARGVVFDDHTREAGEIMEHFEKSPNEVFEMTLRGEISTNSTMGLLLCAPRLGWELVAHED